MAGHSLAASRSTHAVLRGPGTGEGREGRSAPVIGRRANAWAKVAAMRLVALLAVLAACERTVTEHIDGNDGALRLLLVNPTSCSACDPWRGVDTVRIEVLRHDELVAAAEFSYPGEALSLPDLEGFGVVRVVVSGLSGGEVISAGRTAEITLAPGITREWSLVFLPVNQGLPLTSSMMAPRSRHQSITLRDGRVLLAGGLSPGRGAAYAGIEAYNPSTGAFAGLGYDLAGDAGDMARLSYDDGEVMFVGGTTVAGGVETPVTTVTGFLEEADNAYPLASLPVARSAPCASRFAAHQAIVFGGHQGDPYGDMLVLGEDGRWAWSSFPMRDLDETRVTGCVALADDRTFVQGLDADSTGVWPFTSESAPYLEPAECFEKLSAGSAGEAAVYGHGMALVSLADGAAWVGGGLDASSGRPAPTAREFDPSAMRFVEARSQPTRSRVEGPVVDWIFGDWKAWGCGFVDGSRGEPESSVELFDIESGDLGPVVGLDRERPGCHLAVMHDGSVLVTGGFDEGDEAAVSAAIIIPWLD